MKVKLSFFMALLMLMMLMAFSPISRAACIPAPDPDLNNDGIVNSADLVIVSRSNGVAKGNPRYNLNLLADTNCDGKINPIDIHFVNKAFGQTFPVGPATSIAVVDLSSGGEFNVNNSESITTAIHFISSSTDKPYTVRITQTIKPEYGLIVKPIFDGKQYTFSQSSIERIEQSVSATTPGNYEITTTSTIVETGQSASRIVKFKVLPVGTPDLSAYPPSIHLEPSMLGKSVVLKPNTITKVAFTIGSAQGKDGGKVTGMTVVEPKRNITVQLNDSGLGVDKEANDRVYGSEFININSAGMKSGECMTFHTIVHTTMGDVNSSGNDLCISALGLGSYQYAKADWLQDGELRFARNTISIMIRKGTSDARIQQIAASINSTVVSGNPDFGSFVFKLNQIPAAKNAMNVIMQKSKQLMLLPEVEIAGPTISGAISSSYSNDPLFEQTNPSYVTDKTSAISQTRADEAWLVVRGKAGIAILDTGVAANHQDLNGKIISGGYNFAEDNNDTNDTQHHGSHVAGIAAAQSNNGLGITAVSWDSKILPVKIYPGSEAKDTPPDVMAKAIKSAADNPETKIINFSTGFKIPGISSLCALSLLNPLTSPFYTSTPTLSSACDNDIDKIQKALEGSVLVCKEVAYAVSLGKVFIAAAGNKNSDVVDFPAACPGAVAVGAVEPSNFGGILGDPVRWVFAYGVWGSHYGSRVDLAAAGSEVLSTVPPQTCNTSWSTEVLFPCIDDVNGYQHISGTSQAAPMVAGAAAVVLAKHPLFKPSEVINRLKQSAKPLLTSEELGAGALNVFDAVFNGDFEITTAPESEEPVEWKQHIQANKSCASKTTVLGLLPTATANNKRMLVCNNIGVVSAGEMNEIDIPNGVTELPISFDWRVVAEDLTATGRVNATTLSFCDPWGCASTDSPRDDRVLVQLNRMDTNQKTDILFTRLSDLKNLMPLTPLIKAPNNWYGIDWRTFSKTVSGLSAGKYQLQVRVVQSGLDINGNFPSMEGATLFMMDRVRFRR